MRRVFLSQNQARTCPTGRCHPKLEVLEDRCLLSASLVRDLRPGAASSNPGYYDGNSGGMVEIDGVLYFTADDGVHGYELWRSDGTEEGTTLVKDLRLGRDDSYPRHLTNLNGQLFFAARGSGYGQALWKSDGTEAGTVVVADWSWGSATSLAAIDGTLFTGWSGQQTIAFARTDGTEEGTVVLWGRGAFGGIDSITNLDGLVVFSGHQYGGDFVEGPNRQVWLYRSDGTREGTVLIWGEYAENVCFYLGKPAVANGRVNYAFTFHGPPAKECAQYYYPLDSGSLLSTTGFDVSYLASFADLGDPVAVSDTVYFPARTAGAGWELWKSDGTTPGTVLVRDINPGAADSSPARLTAVSGYLFFSANDGVSGRELWRSDGTEEGTWLVQDLNPGVASSNPSGLTDWYGYLFFAADAVGSGRELYFSDGTPEGTFLLEDINPGAAGSAPQSLINVGGTVFFSASEPGTGRELWRWDWGGSPGRGRGSSSERRGFTASLDLFVAAWIGGSESRTFARPEERLPARTLTPPAPHTWWLWPAVTATEPRASGVGREAAGALTWVLADLEPVPFFGTPVCKGPK